LYGWKADLSDQNRAIVRVAAGEAAERLAWLFVSADDATLANAGATVGAAGDPEKAIIAVAGQPELVTKRELASLTMLSRAAREAT
jgi:hypothetical protein